MPGGVSCLFSMIYNSIPVESRKCHDRAMGVCCSTVSLITAWSDRNWRFVGVAQEIVDSGVIVGIDSKPLHPGYEGCAADPHACRCALGTSDSAFAFGQYANDLVMLPFGVLTLRALALHRSDRLPDDSGNIVFRFCS